MIHIDFEVSEDCINMNSYGMICVKCGCCSRNPDYRDRLICRIKYYKQCLEHEYAFNDWWNNDELRKLQEENARLNILYFKRKIRRCKKLLRCADSRKKK